MLEFWGQERFHDISFHFEENQGGPKILRANKTILALCSPVFEEMFFGDSAEKQDPIPIFDVDSTIFEGFLRYIYTEEFHADSLEDAQNLCCVAHKYEVTPIESACELYMIRNIQKFDLSELISFADMYSMKNLMELCRLQQTKTDLPEKCVKYQKEEPLSPTTVNVNFDSSKDETMTDSGILPLVDNQPSHNISNIAIKNSTNVRIGNTQEFHAPVTIQQFLIDTNDGKAKTLNDISSSNQNPGYNVKSIGIAFIGTFNKIVPPPRQIAAAKLLIQEGVKHKYLASDYKLYGHRQFYATESPGNALYNIIKTWPHWSSENDTDNESNEMIE
uniref:CSON006429 protein n=1 Tax=Culicoides sonorensis TaxID=179676 RepID=A0A336MT78_CULSO